MKNTKEYTRWSTSNNGEIIPFSDLNLPTEFVMKHFKGAIIAEGELLLPIRYSMVTIIELYKYSIKNQFQEFEISECITYKHLAIPISFILENFPDAEISYSENGEKVLKLPNSCGIGDIVKVYKTYLISSMVESL